MPSFLSRLRSELLHLTKNASTGRRRRRQAVIRPTISAEQLEFRELLSAVALVVEDAVPGGGINNDAGIGSDPGSLINVNGVLYFQAFDSVNGAELWRVDSTGIAKLVEDAIPGGGIRPGAASGLESPELIAVNNSLYFTGNDGVNGGELWRINSSGIAEMVEDAIPGEGIATGTFRDSSPENLTNIGGTLYFEASDEATGRELWRINSAGIAEMVEDAVPGNGIRPGSSTFGEVLENATNVNGTLYFRMQPDQSSRAELWRVNNSGIAEAVPVSIPSGVVSRPEIAARLPENLKNINGTLYFTAWDGNTSGELWRVNSSGVAELVDDTTAGVGIGPGFTFSPYISQLSNVNGTLFFRANDGVNGPELWRINDVGIAEMVEDAVPGGGLVPGGDGSSPRGLTDVDGTLYFLADGIKVWRINSSGIAERIAIAPSSPQNASIGVSGEEQSVNGTFYFLGDDPLNGTELWRVNSSGLAELVEDSVPGGGIRPGAASAEIQYLTNINGTLYFQANDGTNGVELWRINDTGNAEIVNRTDEVTGINPGANGSLPRINRAAEVNGVVFFNAGAGAEFERELWTLQTNAAPVNLTLSNLSIPENSPIGTAVGQLRTTDPNISNTFAYALVTGTGSGDNARFQIAGDTVRTASTLNFEVRSSYSIRVRTTDQEGLSFEKVFVISVTNVNESPTALTLAGSVAAENSPAGTTVGSFSTTDPDASNTFSYALVSGTGSTDNAGFTINGNTLKTAASFNFETKSSYSIRVKSADQGGLSFERVFTISVTNVAEAPTALALSTSTVPEDVVAGTSVGTFTSTDPDSGSSFTYVLASGAGSTDNASFSIVGNALKTATPLNFEMKSGYSIRVRTTDQSGLSFEQVFSVSVTNVNETPTALTLSRNTIAENLPLNSTVGTFTTSDPDIANTFTYTLVSGEGSADNSSFTISGNSLRTAAALNFEAQSSYSVRVRTSDQSGSLLEQTFAITVTNVNEPPTGLAISSTSIAENQPAGVTVGAFSSQDPDGAGVLTYALVTGVGSTDNSAFSISGNALKTTAAFNFELKKSYSVRVRTTDQSGQFLEKSFLIAVTNVNESPTGLSLSKTAIAENLPAGSSVGTFSAIDPDASSTFTYSLIVGSGSTDNTRFTIDGNTLKTTASFNFEAKSIYSIRVRTTDQGGLSFDKVFAITVTDVNDAPVIGAFDTSVTYTENGLPTVLDLNATATDADSLNLATGRLTAVVSANAQPTDRIGIKHTGNAAGQIGVAGNSVSYGGVAIGTFSGTTTFVVTLNTSATPAAVQALLRSLTFSIVSDTPSTLDRTVKITLTDGDGGTSGSPTKTVRVIAMNDAPVIVAFDTPVTYTENGLPTVLDLNATATDADSLNLATGRLTAVVSANAQPTDRIGIKHTGNAAGQIGVAGNSVSYGGVAIGTFSGTTTFVVTLNTSATPAAVQALLRSLTFSIVSDTPSTLDRTVKITLTDGDGGTSGSPTKTVRVIAVNDVPVIAAFDAPVKYRAGGTGTILDSNAIVTDADSVNFDLGKLTFRITANVQSTDVLQIRHQGTAAGQIGVNGSDVLYGGIAIGKITGGIGSSPLVVTFSSAATSAAVQAVIRNVTFRNTSAAPGTLPRTVSVSLSDGDGGISAVQLKQIEITL